MEKTHWKKVVSDPNYIGEGDFQEGQEIIVTIKKVVAHDVVKTAEGKSDKAVAYFEEPYKPMILNVARSKSITKVAGSPYFEDWVGVKIQLYIEHGIKAFGDVVNAVRVRPFKPKVQTIHCEVCKGEIKGFGNKTASEIANHTMKKYGKKLCSECATKMASEVKKDGSDEQ